MSFVKKELLWYLTMHSIVSETITRVLADIAITKDFKSRQTKYWLRLTTGYTYTRKDIKTIIHSTTTSTATTRWVENNLIEIVFR